MANTVKIYKATCDEAYAMYEQGTGYSLNPWGQDTIDYKGSDDGGQDYILPEGFRVGESNGGTMEIYDTKNEHFDLRTAKNGKPMIVSAWEMIILEKAEV